MELWLVTVFNFTVKQPEPQQVLHEKYPALLLVTLKGSNWGKKRVNLKSVIYLFFLNNDLKCVNSKSAKVKVI